MAWIIRFLGRVAPSRNDPSSGFASGAEAVGDSSGSRRAS